MAYATGAQFGALQWGRRVNATESPQPPPWISSAMGALQWGRRVNATESLWKSGCDALSLSLQWGRRVNATERSRFVISLLRVTSSLQWGRRVNATESCVTIALTRLQRSGFNGAAA